MVFEVKNQLDVRSNGRKGEWSGWRIFDECRLSASKNSIHPSIFFRLSGPRSQWQQTQQGPRDFLLPSNDPLLLLGDPRPDEIYNPSSGFWVCPGVSSQPDLSRKGKGSGRILIRCPKHLRLLLSMRRSSGSTPISLRMSELLNLSPQPIHPAEETHCGRLYPQSRSFSHYPKLVTIGEGCNVDGFTFQLSFLFTTMDQYSACITADAAPNRLSILPFTREKDPEIL